jgi:hypothetical protein
MKNEGEPGHRAWELRIHIPHVIGKIRVGQLCIDGIDPLHKGRPPLRGQQEGDGMGGLADSRGFLRRALPEGLQELRITGHRRLRDTGLRPAQGHRIRDGEEQPCQQPIAPSARIFQIADDLGREAPRDTHKRVRDDRDLFASLSVHKNVGSIPEAEPMLPIIASRMFIHIHA